MKEKITKIIDKMKDFWKKVKEPLGKLKEQLKKNNALHKVMELAKKHRLVLSIIFFCVVMLTLILVAVLGWGEFVVPVCVLMILEVVMAVLLHHTEIWIHGVLVAMHIIVGILIARLPLTILCIIAYIAATLTQRMAFTDEEKHE